MARTLFTGCFTDSGSSTGSALSARRLARESRSRPWLANSILARKGTVHSAVSSAPCVGGDLTIHEEKSSGSQKPASPAGNKTLVTSSSEESLMAEKATGVAGVVASVPAKGGLLGTLRAKANSLARIPSRIPRLRMGSACEEATEPSHVAALSEGHVELSPGSGNPTRSRAGAIRGVLSSGWVRRVTAAVSSHERRLMEKIAGSSKAHPAKSRRVPARPRSASAVLRAGLKHGRDLTHAVSPPLLMGKVSSALGLGVSSDRERSKKSILKVKDPTKRQSVEESRVRSLLDRVQIKQRPRVHFDGYPVTFAVFVDSPDDYDRTSTVCWSCNLNAVVEGGHDEDCSSYDEDPYVEAPSGAAWARAQRRLLEAHEEALAIASGGAIRC